MQHTIDELVDKLALTPHPEGGFFKETYRSLGEIDASSLPESYGGKRNYSTCIYFLLTSANFSAFHRIKQDEIWHFYDGAPIKIHMISPTGAYSYQLVGRNITQGELPQFVVPGGYWFASEVVTPDSYALAGCTVSPGFSFEDFELKPAAELTDLFPEHKTIITRLTRT